MQKLYDANMRLQGYYLRGAAGARTAVYDADMRPLGYYYPHSDKTYDANMRLVGRGNLLAGFLRDAVFPATKFSQFLSS